MKREKKVKLDSGRFLSCIKTEAIYKGFFGLQFYITVILEQPTIYMDTHPMELSHFFLKAENLSFVYFFSNC